MLYLNRVNIITLYNSKIVLSLHYVLTPQFETFTNLLIGIFRVSNPTFLFLFFFEIFEKLCVIILCYNVILLFILDICVNKKAPSTQSVHWGLNPLPQPQKHNSFFLSFGDRMFFFFEYSRVFICINFPLC